MSLLIIDKFVFLPAGSNLHLQHNLLSESIASKDRNPGDLVKVVARRFSVKKVFSEISQNSQENTSARVSF